MWPEICSHCLHLIGAGLCIVLNCCVNLRMGCLPPHSGHGMELARLGQAMPRVSHILELSVPRDTLWGEGVQCPPQSFYSQKSNSKNWLVLIDSFSFTVYPKGRFGSLKYLKFEIIIKGHFFYTTLAADNI